MRRAAVGSSITERIELHTDRSSGCWIWTGGLSRKGYAHLTYGGRTHRVHRLTYEIFVGPIPDGLVIDHLCRTRACVNPEHLEPVTAQVNTDRSPIVHGSKTHCRFGHPYAGANLGVWVDPNGYEHRWCRTCNAASSMLRRQSTPEQRRARKAAGLPVVDLDGYFTKQPEVGLTARSANRRRTA